MWRIYYDILWPTSMNPRDFPKKKKKSYNRIAWNLHFLCVCPSTIETRFYPDSKVLSNFSHSLGLGRYMLYKWIYWATFYLISSRVIVGLSGNTVCFAASNSQNSNRLRSGLYGTHSWSVVKEAKIENLFQ